MRACRPGVLRVADRFAEANAVSTGLVQFKRRDQVLSLRCEHARAQRAATLFTYCYLSAAGEVTASEIDFLAVSAGEETDPKDRISYSLGDGETSPKIGRECRYTNYSGSTSCFLCPAPMTSLLNGSLFCESCAE